MLAHWEVGSINRPYLKDSNTAFDHWLSAVALKLANFKIILNPEVK